MTSRAWWAAGAAGLVVLGAMALLAARGCGQAPAPSEFVTERPELESPDLDVELLEVRGIPGAGSTDWTLRLQCRERSGCRADVSAVVYYRSAGEPRTLKIVGRLSGGRDEILWLHRAQRPPVAVDRVERVVIEVLAPFDPAAPVPTPMV